MATEVLILSPYAERLMPAFSEKDHVTVADDLTIDHLGLYDWVVSYGHRSIIREPFISSYRGRLINLHISYLPYNRGADPNFWAWFDGTPHGVSLHEIDKGVDTGRLLHRTQVKMSMHQDQTLRTSYNQLHEVAVMAFKAVWPSVRNGSVRSWPQEGRGTYHRAIDREPIFDVLPLGWDTPVKKIAELGAAARKAEE